MNAMQEYIERQKVVCRDEWFKNHKANVIIGPVTTNAALIIGWQNPESWNYGCRFILHRRWLIVVGDIGEAVYEWGQDITLAWLAKLDFDYFWHKCRASEDGTKFEMHESRVGYALVQQWLAEQDAENPPGETDDHREHIRSITANSAADEIGHLIHHAYDEGLDPEFCAYLSGCFKVPHPRAIGHFVGLQMAIKQLQV